MAIIKGAVYHPYAGLYALGLRVPKFDSRREGRVNQFYKKAHEKNTKADATSCGCSRSNSRIYECHENAEFRILASCCSRLSALLSLYLHLSISSTHPPLFLVCRRGATRQYLSPLLGLHISVQRLICSHLTERYALLSCYY
jgi:hypothetical protein